MDPGRRVRVRFDRRITATRPPYDDEYSVIREVSRHLYACRRCVVFADPERDILLCRTGYALAKDVWGYLRLDDDKVTSTIASRTDPDAVEIAIPPKYDIVRRLLSQRRGPRDSPSRAAPPLESRAAGHAGLPDDRGRAPRKRDSDFVQVNAVVESFALPLLIRRSDLRRLEDPR
jgi:hypothetical protein